MKEKAISVFDGLENVRSLVVPSKWRINDAQLGQNPAANFGFV